MEEETKVKLEARVWVVMAMEEAAGVQAVQVTAVVARVQAVQAAAVAEVPPGKALPVAAKALGKWAAMMMAAKELQVVVRMAAVAVAM